MDIPRGFAAVALQEKDFLDFIFNYLKAEYAPIRSFWSTATAVPTLPERWVNMGHDLSPTALRAANGLAQKDIESVDFFTRKWSLDADFVRGLIIRYSKYELHDRLERKLFESGRLDLMVRKALKEKHLIDALWPSPAPRNLPTELLQQGVQVRKWYGDMFHKYFRVLHSVEEFQLRPEVDARIKATEKLMLVPFVDHIIFGTVGPIMPIVAMGTGYKTARGSDKRNQKTLAYSDPERFQIRFDAPADVTDTYTKTVARQCECMKCGARRDVQIMISIDPNLDFASPSVALSASRAGDAGPPPPQKKNTSKTAQKYAPGYNMPGEQDTAPLLPQRPQIEPPVPKAPQTAASDKKKQCPRCTFLNHHELTTCEMCQADLPDEIITKPPSPPPATTSSGSQPAASSRTKKERKDTLVPDERPAGPDRNSLSQSLFSVFPFNQLPQQLHPEQPAQQEPKVTTKPAPSQHVDRSSVSKSTRKPKQEERSQPSSSRTKPEQHIPTIAPPPPHQPTRSTEATSSTHDRPTTPILSRAPEMAMMPMTPPSTNSSAPKRAPPTGLPSNLMDDFVPVSPGFAVHDEEDVDAGWGEMSREEARSEDDEYDEDDAEGKRGLVDLDAVAREEADVWGEREDE